MLSLVYQDTNEIMAKIPKKITPDPIVNSVVEFRFQTPLEKDKIISTLHNLLSSDFPYFQDQLPQIVFPILKPEYVAKTTLRNKDFTVSFGTNVIIFGNAREYLGWPAFSKIVFHFSELLTSKGIMGKIDRVGLRYINFFKDVHVLSTGTNLQINFENKADYNTGKNTQLRTEIQKGKYGFNLVLADNVGHNNALGSMLDIDAYLDNPNIGFSSELIKLVEEIHLEEKILFYGLLKQDFVDKFKPEY